MNRLKRSAWWRRVEKWLYKNFGVGQLQKINFKLKIEKFEIAFQQLSNTENVFYSHFSTLPDHAVCLNTLLIFFESKIWKKFEIIVVFPKFLDFFSNKISWVGLNEAPVEGELKNGLKNNFQCWTAVGMRFQIPQFWVQN